MNAQSSESLANTEAQNSPSLRNLESERAEATSKPKAGAESVKESPKTPLPESEEEKDDSKPKAAASTPKKKRKSPEKPWKKPADMPRRPLSAYNLCKFRTENLKEFRILSLFTHIICLVVFQDEKNRLKAERLKAGPGQSPGTTDSTETEEGDQKPKSKRKHVTVSGIGFANLAKTVAANWKSLDAAAKAPYEKRAALDKARYDKEVTAWREKQKEKKTREKIAQNQSMMMASYARSGSDALDIPPAPSDQSLASLSGLDHPADWFPPGGETQQQDPSLTPHVPSHARAYGNPQGRMSPGPSFGYTGHGQYTNPTSPPGMSPQGNPNSPAGSAFGIHNFHSSVTGTLGGRVQMPVFSDPQNSYSYNNPMSQPGGPPQYSLQPRRAGLFGSGSNPSSPDWGFPMHYMQQSAMLQPLQAFPDDFPLLPPPQEGFPHPAPLQPPPPFASFAPTNPFHDSYHQELGDLSPPNQHNSYSQQTQQSTIGAVSQQPFAAPNQAAHPNQHGEVYDDAMMEFIARLRDTKDPPGPSNQQNPGNS